MNYSETVMINKVSNSKGSQDSQMLTEQKNGMSSTVAPECPETLL